MSDVIEEKTITTDAGDYVLRFISDPCGAENPLTEWDHPGMEFYVQSGNHVTTDTTTRATRFPGIMAEHYDDVDEITRRYAKWRAISGTPWQLFTGSGYGNCQGDQWDWYVLVDTTDWTGTYSDKIEPAVRATMAEYEAWATGDVLGYTLTGPDGDEVESCWGYYGYDANREYITDITTSRAEDDAAQRIEKSNLVGAGFVGLI